jgi:hypothetical protein
MLSRYTTQALYHPYPGCLDVTKMTSDHKQDMETNIQLLIDSVGILNSFGTKFPISIDPEILRAGGEAGQQLLNQLHRCFTNSFRTLNMNNPPGCWTSDGSCTFNVPADVLPKFLDASANINTGVHNLEKFMMSDNKRLSLKNLASRASLYFDAYTVSDSSSILERTAAQHILPEDEQYFSDDPEFDVWVGKDILGKDYMTAFLDNDDPREWDITHLLYYTGRIEIDISEYRFIDRIHSPEFSQWLSRYGVDYDPRMAGIPLGKVVSGKEFIPILATAKVHPIIQGLEIHE